MAVEAGGIGARLRAGREKMGLTVLQVAERIHTDSKIVEAIELENFSVLGAPVYARGHIRHYAELVGESANDLITLYANLNKVAQPDLTQIAKGPLASDTNKLVAPALVVIAVFAVAGAVWWVSALSKKKPQMSDSHVVGQEPLAAPAGAAGGSAPGSDVGSVPAQASVPDQTPVPNQTQAVAPQKPVPPPAIPAVTAPTGGQARTASQPPSRSTSSPPHSSGSGAGSSVAKPTQAPKPTAATGSPASKVGGASTTAKSLAALGSSATTPTRVASAAPTKGSSASSSSAAATASIPVPRSKDQSQVTLRYSADSWTEVYDATGARLFYDVGSANSVQTVYGTAPLRVVLGNASGVAVEFNGHNAPIAKLAHPDGSVQFSINRSGRVIRAKPVPDGG